MHGGRNDGSRQTRHNRERYTAATPCRRQVAKTRLLQLRIAEREGELMMTDDALETLDAIVGLFRTHLSGLAAQCSRDLHTRRAIDIAVNDMLQKISNEAGKKAAQFGKSDRPSEEHE
jgi:hypothetical protein